MYGRPLATPGASIHDNAKRRHQLNHVLLNETTCQTEGFWNIAEHGLDPQSGGCERRRRDRSGVFAIFEAAYFSAGISHGCVRLIESVSKVRGIGAVKPLADAIRPERQMGSA